MIPVRLEERQRLTGPTSRARNTIYCTATNNVAQLRLLATLPLLNTN